MEIISLDLETFYSSDYTLHKLTSEEYIRDTRFEALCLGVCRSDGTKESYGPEEIGPFLSALGGDVAVLCHHAQFDGLILSHHYGFRPALWIDTLSMSRAVRGHLVSHGLKALAEHYGLPEKIVPYNDFKDLHWWQMAPWLRQAMLDGAAHDAWLTMEAFHRLLPDFPESELWVVDQTVRMFTEPMLEGNTGRLREIIIDEEARKGELFAALNVSKAHLRSKDRFVELLEAEGVAVQMKEGKKGPIPALAKTDAFMQELLASDDERIVSLCEARLEATSSLYATRPQRLLDMALRGSVGRSEGNTLPVYLNYAGAHTGRHSGGDSLNLQNLPKKGKLRSCLRAPRGHSLIIVDQKTIEARLLVTVAGQEDAVAAYRNDEDRYVQMAERIYNRAIDAAIDKEERQVGKAATLGCGYGMGWRKFLLTCLRAGIIILEDVAQFAVRAYREAHPEVVKLWYKLDSVLPYLHQGIALTDMIGPCEIGAGKIILPNGYQMFYELEQRPDEKGRLGWYHRTRSGWHKIWGGGAVENLIQALARISLTDACRLAQKLMPILRMLLLVHDEVIFCVPDAAVDEAKMVVHEAFRAPLSWLPEAPLNYEMIVAKEYIKG